MDECISPGILWPYGNTQVKVQLAYLAWNTLCHNNLLRILGGDCSAEQRNDSIKKLALAREYIETQADAVVSSM